MFGGAPDFRDLDIIVATVTHSHPGQGSNCKFAGQEGCTG
jgi:hypothetical protein